MAQATFEVEPAGEHRTPLAPSAIRIPSASASHRRVELSTLVNRNVTTPEGASAGGADTHAECHTEHNPALNIVGILHQEPLVQGVSCCVRQGYVFSPDGGCGSPKR
jgi:hypothetical protein